MSLPDFVMMRYIFVMSERSEYEDRRIYIKKLAENMQLTIPQMSAVINLLQDKGYIIWKHDSDGHEGTYITVTESGDSLFYEQPYWRRKEALTTAIGFPAVMRQN